MPHKRSAAGKRSHQEVKASRKWHRILEGSFQPLWRELEAAIGGRLNYIYIYGQTNDWIGKPSWPAMNRVDLSGLGMKFRIYISTHDLGELSVNVSLTDIIYKGAMLPLEGIVLRPEWRSVFAVQTQEVYKPFVDIVKAIVHAWLVRTIRSELSRRRVKRFHEELVAAVWHPRRVARLLEVGGWDAVEALG